MDLDLAGGEARVLVAAAATTMPRMPMHPLAASLVAAALVRGAHRRGTASTACAFGSALVGPSGVEHQLGDALAVAQIDEDAAAVVAPSCDPAEEHDLLAHVAAAQGAATVGALELVDESGHVSSGDAGA